jgi:hypothetical protein
MDRGQIIFLSFAALLLLIQTIKGWRLGLVRQIVRFGALAAAYMSAFLFGSAAVPFLRPLGYPDFILQGLGGMAIALAVFLFISLVGGILFKRTAHQNLGLVWFFYGITGAALGLAFGLVLVFLAADAVRLLGGMAEARFAAAATTATLKPPIIHPINTPKSTGPATDGPVWLRELVGIKKYLEKGMAGEILQTVDPVPKKAYVVTAQIGRMVAAPQSVERFLSYPGAQELTILPEITALRQDPEILRALRDGNYLSLLKNPKLVAVANDPKIAAKFKRFEVEKALAYALAK